jgi:hypothetical protein
VGEGYPYGRRYREEREALLALRLPCELRLVCAGRVANSADHDPPIALHGHVTGSGCCRLVPACLACQRVQGGQLAEALRRGLPFAGSRRRRVPAPSRRW